MSLRVGVTLSVMFLYFLFTAKVVELWAPTYYVAFWLIPWEFGSLIRKHLENQDGKPNRRLCEISGT